MNGRHLTCTCGHSWDYSAQEPIPANLRLICPRCLVRTEDNMGKITDASPPDPEPEPAADETKQEFEGFEILEVLNRGGMGVVYKARQKGLDRLVVLKVIAPERMGMAETLRRFKREVQASARLSHPNIVTVYQTDLEGPCPYLAMEYVPGIDLSRLVRQGGPLPELEACRFVLQVAVGLQHAFEQGLVHRDIKPANLMVTPSPLEADPARKNQKFRVIILDMGLARIMDNEDAGELTQAGVFLGTPDFISPEQAEDSRKADIRSDLYSLGGTLYFLLTGRVPFPSKNILQRLRYQLTKPPPSPRKKRQDVSPSLDALVQRLMARNPDERFQEPTELIEALEQIIRNPVAAMVPEKISGLSVPLLSSSIASPTLQAGIHAQAHQGGVESISISADGRWLLSGGADETLRLWDASRLQERATIAGDVGPIAQVGLAPEREVGCFLLVTTLPQGYGCSDLGDGRLQGTPSAARGSGKSSLRGYQPRQPTSRGRRRRSDGPGLGCRSAWHSLHDLERPRRICLQRSVRLEKHPDFGRQ